MDLELEGRLAIVTGASRGIGLAVTRALVEEGAVVVTGSRSVSAPLRTLAETGRVHPYEVDLSTEGGPAELVDRAAQHGDVDVLVNNAGAVVPRVGGYLTVSDDEWRRTLELDLFAALRAMRAVLPGMVARGRGSIVSIASVNAYLPDPLVVDYSAAKAALWNASKALSKEFGPAGIRVNTVSPGPVETDLWLGGGGVASTLGAAAGVDPDAVVQQAKAGFSSGRFTRPEEVADLVLLLAGGRAANVTGADLRIDGGLVQTL